VLPAKLLSRDKHGIRVETRDRRRFTFFFDTKLLPSGGEIGVAEISSRGPLASARELRFGGRRLDSPLTGDSSE
jgi:hypothetical protein